MKRCFISSFLNSDVFLSCFLSPMHVIICVLGRVHFKDSTSSAYHLLCILHTITYANIITRQRKNIFIGK